MSEQPKQSPEEVAAKMYKKLVNPLEFTEFAEAFSYLIPDNATKKLGVVQNYIDCYPTLASLAKRNNIPDSRLNELSSVLVTNFMPTGASEEERAAREDPHMRMQRDEAIRRLVEAGIPLTRAANLEANNIVSRFIDSDAVLATMADTLPLHVISAVTTARMFENVTDETKLERLRNWTTRAFLRRYLRDFKVERHRKNLEFHETLDQIPETVFNTNVNTITFNIIKNHLVSEAMQLFREDEAKGFDELYALADKSDLNSPRGKMLLKIFDEFEKVAQVKIPPVFNETLGTWDSKFPLFRQKYLVHELTKNQINPETGDETDVQVRRKILHGKTGATKTACSYLTMETLGAKKVTIFGPPKARNTWENEYKKLFKNGDTKVKNDVFLVHSQEDLLNEKIKTARYVYVGSSLLGDADNDPKLRELLMQSIVRDRETDGVIIDEADEFRKGDAHRSRALANVVMAMEEVYHDYDDTQKLPILALTATPLVSSLEDFNIPLALMDEKNYAFPKGVLDDVKYGYRITRELGRSTFSRQCNNDPHLAYTKLFGEGHIIQWSLKDIFGNTVPDLVYDRIGLGMGEYRQYIYDMIADAVFSSSLGKIDSLRRALLDPRMLRNRLQNENLVPAYTERTQDELIALIEHLHARWEQEDKQLDIPFNADWIARQGERDLILQTFFNPTTSTLDDLISLVDGTIEYAPSEKYAYIRELLEEKFGTPENPKELNHKVVIVSPEVMTGVTRDRNASKEEHTLIDLIKQQWLTHVPAAMIDRADGSVAIEEREAIAKRFREDENRSKVLVLTLDAMSESIDMAWRPKSDGSKSNIEDITVVFLGWPWGWDDFEQMCGRFIRPGLDLDVPVNFKVLEVDDTLDEGFYELVLFKYLLGQMSLYGLQLEKEEQDFFDNARTETIIGEAENNRRFLKYIFTNFRAMGSDYCTNELFKNDGVLANRFAEAFYDNGNDALRIVGNNAEMIKNLVVERDPESLLVLGAGSCLLSRKLVQAGARPKQILNVDINPITAEKVKKDFPEIGNIAQASAQDLSVLQADDNQFDTIDDESFEAVDCSFMLDWSEWKPSKYLTTEDIQQAERVQILSEINRVLKKEGTAFISLPTSTFTKVEQFKRFIDVLENNFGLVIDGPCGLARTDDLNIKPPKEISWILTLKKEREVNLQNIDLYGLSFDTDSKTVISSYKPERKTKTLKPREVTLFAASGFEIFNPINNSNTLVNNSQLAQVDYSPQIQEDTAAPSLAENPEQSISTTLYSVQVQMYDDAVKRIIERLELDHKEARELFDYALQRWRYENPVQWTPEGLASVADRIRKVKNGINGKNSH